MPHFYVDPNNIKGNDVVIENEQYHYLSNVRRFSVGDEINIFDGLGNSFKILIKEVNKKSIKASVISSKTFKTPNKIVTLFTAIPKGERFDWLIEKASEIGVSKIVPIIYSRSVVTDFSQNKLERYRKISISASSQSWRADIMSIDNPIKFSTAIELVSAPKNVLNILPWESEENNNIVNMLQENKEIKNINIFIGPEGGFDSAEIDLAIKNNFKLVTLGENILRVETAGIVSSSIVLASL